MGEGRRRQRPLEVRIQEQREKMDRLELQDQINKLRAKVGARRRRRRGR